MVYGGLVSQTVFIQSKVKNQLLRKVMLVFFATKRWKSFWE
jgi:hypothetical protein